VPLALLKVKMKNLKLLQTK